MIRHGSRSLVSDAPKPTTIGRAMLSDLSQVGYHGNRLPVGFPGSQTEGGRLSSRNAPPTNVPKKLPPLVEILSSYKKATRGNKLGHT